LYLRYYFVCLICLWFRVYCVMCLSVCVLSRVVLL